MHLDSITSKHSVELYFSMIMCCCYKAKQKVHLFIQSMYTYCYYELYYYYYYYL